MNFEELKKNKTFCPFAWIQLHTTPVGVIKPCCIFESSLKNEDGSTVRLNSNQLEQIWNGKSFVELREKMIKGEYINGCEKCYHEEEASGSSQRTKIIDQYYEMKLNDLVSTFNSKQDQLPIWVDLKIGNVCNLKCRMCQPLDSQLIDLEFTAISKKEPLFRGFDNASAFDYNYNVEPIELASNWIYDEVAKENLKLLFKNVIQISLAGGETTFTKEAIEILNFCVEESISTKIDVVMSSNLTRMSDKLINLMSRFKRFIVMCSIDGVGDLANYIRYPSGWDEIKTNYLKLVHAPETIIPIITPTIQIYNILNCVEIFEVFEGIENNKWKNLEPCNIVILHEPQHLSIRHLPKSIKDIALKRLENFELKSKYLKENKYYFQQFNLLKETLKVDYFDAGRGNNSNEYLESFLQYTEILDNERGQSFRDELPELNRLLEIEKIKKKFPKEDPRTFTYYRFRDIGFKLFSEKKYTDAILFFEKALELFKEDSDLLFCYGLCLKNLDYKQKAVKIFEKILTINPDLFANILELIFLKNERIEVGFSFNFLNDAAKKAAKNDSEIDLLNSININEV